VKQVRVELMQPLVLDRDRLTQFKAIGDDSTAIFDRSAQQFVERDVLTGEVCGCAPHGCDRAGIILPGLVARQIILPFVQIGEARQLCTQTAEASQFLCQC